MDDDMELWKNVGRGRVVVKKRGEYGVEIDEMIGGGRTFHITPQDRRLNQERAANKDLDVFTNGFLAPVRLLDTEKDTADLQLAPNLITEDDMRKILKADSKQFATRLATLSHEALLTRLLEVAKEEDVPVSRLEAIESRLNDVTPIQTRKSISHAPEGGPSSMKVVRA